MSMQELFVSGERLVGGMARDKNLSAVLAVVNAVKSSYGPHGLDKMLVSKIGDITITNDGATILGSMETNESAGRILVDLAVQQDSEEGDGTTTVVILAGALIENGMALIDEGVHPTSVVSGYKTAFRQAVRFIRDKLERKLKTVTVQDLTKIAESTIASKVLRNSSKIFSKIIVDAIQSVKRVDQDKNVSYSVEEVNILKKQGKSMDESVFVSGYAVNCALASKLMPASVAKARIVCLDMDLQGMKMGLSVKITVENPDDLEKIRDREMHCSTEKVKKLLGSGINVIFTTKGISEPCIKAIVDAGAIGVRRCKREDLERVARVTGTQVYSSFDEVDGSEFVPTVGMADSVSVESFGEDQCIIVNSSRCTGSSIVLRGPNEQMLDEMERSIHDGLCALKRTLESKSVVVGGGAFETAVSAFLSDLAISFGTNEQIAIQRYADALLQIPKTLLINAALDPNDLLAKLLSMHGDRNWDAGLDLDHGDVRNNFKAGVIEPLEIKLRSLRAATEAAISILRIDEVITLDDDQENK